MTINNALRLIRIFQIKEQGERILVALTCNDENMRAFQKWELPYRMHFSESPRVPPIILDFNIGWRGVFREERYNGSGAHGWDNLYPEMQAIFVAYGPSFRSNVETKPFENIELYNLMCALLNVTPAENNGTWGALHHLLVDPPTFPERYNGEYPEMIRILQMPSNIEIVTTKSCGALSNSTSIELVELKVSVVFNLSRYTPNSIFADRPLEHGRRQPNRKDFTTRSARSPNLS